MVKEPRAGRVKTRLARDIGPTAAAWWFRHQVRHLLRKIDDPRWRIVLAVSPDGAALHNRCLPDHFPRWPQGRGDLGRRMARMMRKAPPGPVCVIGADIPGITPRALDRAFAALGQSEAVFGPADDGGYWLVGIRNSQRVPKTLFENVRWSTEHALADTVASLGGTRVAYTETLTDVDTLADLQRVRRFER